MEEESFSLALVEAAKLPTNQRHQFGVFIDSLFDTYEFPTLFKSFQMFPDVFVVVLFGHECSFRFDRPIISICRFKKNRENSHPHLNPLPSRERR